MSDEDFELIRGSGNVFRDFGDPNADLEQARAILAAKIINVLDDRKLSVRAAEPNTSTRAPIWGTPVALCTYPEIEPGLSAAATG